MELPMESVEQLRRQIDQRLSELLPPDTAAPQNLHRAIRYSGLAPGKRLRGVMTLLAAGMRPGGEQRALDMACAIELAHAASLIIDDLPAMDDAVMRRGQPANHCIFGEDTATLAAFALLNRAYGVIAEAPELSPALRSELAALLHRAVGTAGLIGGQELDLHTEDADNTIHDISSLYEQKTGVLFVAAVAAGARIAGLTDEDVGRLRRYARYLGIACQLADDLADSTAARGIGVPAPAAGASMAGLLGRRQSTQLLEELVKRAVQNLEPLGPPAAPLAALAGSMFNTATLNTPTRGARQLASA